MITLANYEILSLKVLTRYASRSRLLRTSRSTEPHIHTRGLQSLLRLQHKAWNTNAHELSNRQHLRE